MSIKMLTVVTTVGLMLAATVTHAHSASEHKKKKAEKPKCEAINNMDHSKMDMNDPIMQAMMKQCMGTDNKGSGSHSSEHKPDGHKGTDHNESKPKS